MTVYKVETDKHVFMLNMANKLIYMQDKSQKI